MKRFTIIFPIRLLLILVLGACSTPSHMINDGRIKLGMPINEFRSKMYWGVDVQDDPWQEAHGGSGFYPGYEGFYFVSGGRKDHIFLFNPDKILIAISKTSAEAENIVDEIVHGATLKTVSEREEFFSESNSQSSLISCPTDTSLPWTNCFSAITFDDGESYAGEWKDDKYNGQGTYFFANGNKYVGEWKDNKFNGQGTYFLSDGRIGKEGIWKDDEFQYSRKLSSTHTPSVSAITSPKPTSAELIASQKEASRLRNELATLKAKQAEISNKIASDTQVPLITITASSSNGPQGTINGRVSDNSGIGEVRVNGQLIQIDYNGNFTANTYVPEGGVSVTVEAVDLAGLSSSMSVRLNRSISPSTASMLFDKLNPLGRKVYTNDNALALIIGVDGYKSTTARAIYADSDAKVFADYASQKLGVPGNGIKTLVNNSADESGMLLAIKKWLSRSVQQDKTDVYIFFAGHGLASDDGQKMYLLPYDGAPELLEKTAILRRELFLDIASANPRSVTVFLDTCYSGKTRGTDMLIASRPVAIRAIEQSIPDNFTVMTAAAGDQTAKPLEEAKHGMFSYFLMKGMEGEADANNDNQITAGELHAYVERNVIQQSSGSQTPELQGDASRVLVQFQ